MDNISTCVKLKSLTYRNLVTVLLGATAKRLKREVAKLWDSWEWELFCCFLIKDILLPLLFIWWPVTTSLIQAVVSRTSSESLWPPSLPEQSPILIPQTMPGCKNMPHQQSKPTMQSTKQCKLHHETRHGLASIQHSESADKHNLVHITK